MRRIMTATHAGPPLSRVLLLRQREERAHILGRDRRGGELALADYRIEERGLRGLQLHDLLFDRALGDQPVHVHLPLLADAVNTVHGLLLGGRVPPRIHDEHVVRLG